MSLALCSLCRFPTAVWDFLSNVERNVMRGRDIEMYPWWLAAVHLSKALPLHVSKWDTGQNKISEFTPNNILLRMFCFVLITILCVQVSLHRPCEILAFLIDLSIGYFCPYFPS